MRTKDTLLKLEDITILYQYLYMSEDHHITVDNGLTKLLIKMNENGVFRAKNLKFPDLPDFNYSEMMTVPNIMAIIEQLEEVPPLEFADHFKNRWEEIKETTLSNLALNRKR